MTPSAGSTPSPRHGVPCRCLLACAALLGASGAAMAGDAIDGAVQTALARADDTGLAAASGPRLSITTEIDTVHARLGGNAPLPLGADGRALTDLAGVNYRLWMGRGSTELGVGVGTLGYVDASPDPHELDGPRNLVGASPTFALGLRHRMSTASMVYADAVGTRNLGGQPRAGYVGTKVGIEWKPATRRFGFDHGALGLHLDSGYRIALKAHHGGLGLYLRGQF